MQAKGRIRGRKTTFLDDAGTTGFIFFGISSIGNNRAQKRRGCVPLVSAGATGLCAKKKVRHARAFLRSERRQTAPCRPQSSLPLVIAPLSHVHYATSCICATETVTRHGRRRCSRSKNVTFSTSSSSPICSSQSPPYLRIHQTLFAPIHPSRSSSPTPARNLRCPPFGTSSFIFVTLRSTYNGSCGSNYYSF